MARRLDADGFPVWSVNIVSDDGGLEGGDNEPYQSGDIFCA